MHLLVAAAEPLRAYGALGQVYSEGRLDEARREFEAIAARQPTSVGAHTLLAMIQELEQKPGHAKKTYERVLDLDPQAVVAANNLACLYVRIGANLDVALQLAQTAISRFPNEPEFSDTLGWIYVKKNLPDSAIPPLQDSVRLNPQNASFRYHLAVAYLRKGDQRLARVHLDRALGLQQDFEGLDGRAGDGRSPAPDHERRRRGAAAGRLGAYLTFPVVKKWPPVAPAIQWSESERKRLT